MYAFLTTKLFSNLECTFEDKFWQQFLVTEIDAKILSWVFEMLKVVQMLMRRKGERRLY